jgi:Fur family transcriptional regulator, peroxide stress response regulator
LNNLKEKLELFHNLCRRKHLKITPQRIEVYKALITSSDHPSAETVYERVKQVLPNVSLDTVNRTLNTLNKIGAAFIVEGSGDVKRFDGNLEKHQHFKCIKCRKIFDFRHEGFENMQVPGNLGQEFKVLKITVYVEGLCRPCIERGKQV